MGPPYARIAKEYDALLEEFIVGDHGRAELLDGERRVTVRQRLQAAARWRNLALHFRPGRRALIFRVNEVVPRTQNTILLSAAESLNQTNWHATAQSAPKQRRPRRKRQPAAGRYDAMLPRWMREGSQPERRGGSKRRMQ